MFLGDARQRVWRRRALRDLWTRRAPHRSDLSWGAPIVNVTGSFIIGFFATLTGPDGRMFIGTEGRQFVMTGVCGGYTTFSSFSLQTLNLVSDGEISLAAGNVGASLLLCLLAVWAGHDAASALNRL